MKRIITFSIILLLLVCCSNSNNCNNRIDFVDCDDTIPVMDIQINKTADSIRKDLSKLYGIDLYSNCGWENFKMPFSYHNKSIFLKIIVDYSNGEGCPITEYWSRSFINILFNNQDKLLFEGRPILKDSLKSNLEAVLRGIGTDEYLPESYLDLWYQLGWSTDCNKNMLDSILSDIIDVHVNFIEQEIVSNDLDFCKLEEQSLDSLRKLYPLQIEFELDKHIVLFQIPENESDLPDIKIENVESEK